MIALEERFTNKIQVDNDSGCWVWTAAKQEGGYGRFGYKGKTVSTHRLAYELLVGPIPEGLIIDHLCRNRACCNPQHLEPVTHRENNLRGEKVGAQVALTHCLRGHPLSGDNLYVRTDGRNIRECKACRSQANVNRSPEAKARYAQAARERRNNKTKEQK